MCEFYTRHFDKEDCNLLAEALDFYVCNFADRSVNKSKFERLMMEFDAATELFAEQPVFEHIDDKIIKLSFE